MIVELSDDILGEESGVSVEVEDRGVEFEALFGLRVEVDEGVVP